MNSLDLWKRYKKYLCDAKGLGLRVDISRMNFENAFLERMSAPMDRALTAMEALEGGSLANSDENRMVGHYWLRAPQLAPEPSIRSAIEKSVSDVHAFAREVHAGTVTPERTDGFYVVLMIGIGGSALGPQFLSDALGSADDPMLLRFIDNTDPDGIDRVVGELDETLEQTLTVVVSKSGNTKETRNGMLEIASAYRSAGLTLAKHAVAVTAKGSALFRKAAEQQWLRTFEMWDWIGGRTSVLSSVGLLPAALQGIDIDALLAGARECDAATRNRSWRDNPAALLALMWYYAGDGKGARNMVVLPYCDRLKLLGRYLQQLIMESLGKEFDRAGRTVHQGLTVYGNKGSTDQHAYVQQLRDGPADFFATFITVGNDREGESIRVEEDVTSGDMLHAYWQGTRQALYEKGRESITITLDRLDARSVGALIALFERAVGLYAELINVNAYHQPGVEAGKRAADQVNDLQRKVLAHFRNNPGTSFGVDDIADAVGAGDSVETVYHILEHAAANRDHNITSTAGKDLFSSTYRLS